MRRDQRVGGAGLGEIAGHADHLAAGLGLHARHSLIDALLRSARHDHARAFASQARGDGVADAGGAAGDQREFAFEFQIHAAALPGSPRVGARETADFAFSGAGLKRRGDQKAVHIRVRASAA